MPDRTKQGSDSRPELTVFKRASSPIEAELIAGVLRSAGIPVHVGGGMLTDEFAVTQRMLNLSAVDVLVPSDRVDAAKAALEAARASSAEVEAAAAATISERPASPSPPAEPVRYPWLLVGALAIAAVASVVLWQEARAEVRALTSPLTVYTGEKSGVHVWEWADTHKTASTSIDHDRNGVPDSTTAFNRDGRALYTAVDRNGNGIVERFEGFGPAGEATTLTIDADENGVAERTEHALGSGKFVILDANQDGISERYEQLDAQGKLVRAWRLDPVEGLVPAK
jgi:hypothetical protein